MGRLAGRVLQIRIDDFEAMSSRMNPKNMAMEKLVRHMEHDCPKCVGCSEIRLQEDQDYIRMAKLYAVTCKHRAQNSGDMVRCPDGFYGMYDAVAKEVREIKLEMPVTTTSLSEFGSMTMATPSWEFVKPAPAPGDFLREYMTDPSIANDKDVMQRVMEEKAKRAGEEQEKLLRRKMMLGEFDTEGVSKIKLGLDTLLRPATQIPTDRTAFPPVKPRNKDVPQTADEGAW